MFVVFFFICNFRVKALGLYIFTAGMPRPREMKSMLEDAQMSCAEPGLVPESRFIFLKGGWAAWVTTSSIIGEGKGGGVGRLGGGRCVWRKWWE